MCWLATVSAGMAAGGGLEGAAGRDRELRVVGRGEARGSAAGGLARSWPPRQVFRGLKGLSWHTQA